MVSLKVTTRDNRQHTSIVLDTPCVTDFSRHRAASNGVCCGVYACIQLSLQQLSLQQLSFQQLSFQQLSFNSFLSTASYTYTGGGGEVTTWRSGYTRGYVPP